MTRVVQTYFGRLDRRATADRADMVLGDYRHRRAKAKRAEIVALQSPNLDGMPSSPSVENRVESKILHQLSDCEFVGRVDAVLECIEDQEARTLLKLLYTGRPMTGEAIMERMSMSNTAYYRARENALVAFAEVWPPAPSELLVYRN